MFRLGTGDLFRKSTVIKTRTFYTSIFILFSTERSFSTRTESVSVTTQTAAITANPVNIGSMSQPSYQHRSHTLSNKSVVGLIVGAIRSQDASINSSGTNVVLRKISGKNTKVTACATWTFFAFKAMATEYPAKARPQPMANSITTIIL